MSLAVKLALMMGGPFAARFITSASYTTPGTSQAVSFSGAAAGDLAIILSHSSSVPSNTPAGWGVAGTYSWTGLGYEDMVFYKVLSSGDISTGSVTISTAGGGASLILAAFYRNATTATVKTSAQSGPGETTLPIAGFTKAAACRGIVSWVVDRDSPSAGITPPTAFTTRIAPVSATNFTGAWADLTAVAAYENNATETWTGFSASDAQAGQLIELT